MVCFGDDRSRKWRWRRSALLDWTQSRLGWRRRTSFILQANGHSPVCQIQTTKTTPKETRLVQIRLLKKITNWSEHYLAFSKASSSSRSRLRSASTLIRSLSACSFCWRRISCCSIRAFWRASFSLAWRLNI